MGFDPITIGVMTAVGGLASTAMQYQASRAAEDQAKYAAKLQDRQAADERETLKENARRKREDRNRYLARVALEQANSGIRSDQGTPVAVLGDITNRLDEELYDYTESALARIGQLQAGAAMSRYAARQERASRPVSAFGSLLQTGARAYGAYDWAAYRNAPNRY